MQLNSDTKNRLFYLLLAVFTAAFALYLRSIWQHLPFFINIWIGDFLWAIMVFWLSRIVFLRTESQKLTLSLIVFCWFVEASQTFHTPSLDAFRDTTLGGLLLGHGFL
ncbi:MAG: DUF2809 domain-containing protein [Saprospiraceae bacterium]|nr:DUF2809 domain-containing protein [Saprospiraceae bacterium]